jgi:hypothetical protein
MHLYTYVYKINIDICIETNKHMCLSELIPSFFAIRYVFIYVKLSVRIYVYEFQCTL